MLLQRQTPTVTAVTASIFVVVVVVVVVVVIIVQRLYQQTGLTQHICLTWLSISTLVLAIIHSIISIL
jgi:hypothetical protein